MTKGPQPRSLEVRFWAKVQMGPGCWLWLGAKRSGGYGVITEGGSHGALLVAHRVMWERAYGPIPDGMNVLHRCDTPGCVRPEHLFLGTQEDNVHDAIEKGRLDPHHRKGRLRGEANPAAKLSDEDREAIRRRYVAGGTSQGALAQEYGVSQGQISRVVRGA